MIGFNLNNKFYHWGERIDKTTLALKKVRDNIAGVVNFTALAAAIICFVYFAYDALVVGPIDKMTSTAYWMFGGLPVAAFWLSVLLVLFIYYRLSEAARQKMTVEKLAYEAQLPQIESADATIKHQVNIARTYNSQAMKAVEEAYMLAEKFQQSIEPVHIFIGTMTTNQISVMFARLGISFDGLKDPLNRRLNKLTKGQPKFTEATERVLVQSYLNAMKFDRDNVSPIELFIESSRADEFVQELFYDLGIEQEMIENVVAWIRINEELLDRYQQFSKAASRKPKGGMNRAMTAVATPMLDQVSDDLTRAAAYGKLPMLINRESEIEQIFRIIEGGNQSVVLVGPPGVGKSALIYGIAERMVEERVPKILEDKRLVQISVPHIVSGASPAEAQERLLMVLNEVARSRNIVLIVEGIEELTGISAGGGLSSDLSSILIDALNRGFTFLIASSTPEAYTEVIERSPLGQVLQKVQVDEPELNEAIQVLEAKVSGIEYQNNVIFSYAALADAVKLSDRYIHDRYLPEKAVEICSEVALAVAKSKGANALVTAEDVAVIITEKTKIPVQKVSEDETEKLLQLEVRMHERMIGQNEAVDAVAAALRRARAELRAENRPIANFLFLGPTGVGKTELAKTTAEVYFGNEGAMQRFDMSEYQNQSSLARMIGEAGEGGLLTEAVRQNPFSLLLLDELEKAHPEILNLFLQVMDDGRLTDGAGRTIDFTNVILIATSNAGTEYIQSEVQKGTDLEDIKNHLIEEELKGIYRPEFLNRFDGVIVFKPLTIDEVVQIAYLMIGQVEGRLEAKGIHFRADDEAVQELAEKGFDPKFGARPLRRVIQDQVDDAVAKVLLEGKVGRRDTVVLKTGGQIEIEKAADL
ncbi:ATP-dependent Clp protease ATP-binding subunit [Patescibacteria group bacterium]|nr:ATP-dependent Clp protease ATP-binding subunit [Patescibacteria group bacterium]MBU1906792.1 ATP-dependent Clp protease ATP-binding subunit [Patescibacteria group bacterium]